MQLAIPPRLLMGMDGGHNHGLAMYARRADRVTDIGFISQLFSGGIMYVLFAPAFLALTVIGFITLRDQFTFAASREQN